jgi:hypothetical protein
LRITGGGCVAGTGGGRRYGGCGDDGDDESGLDVAATAAAVGFRPDGDGGGDESRLPSAGCVKVGS